MSWQGHIASHARTPPTYDVTQNALSSWRFRNQSMVNFNTHKFEADTLQLHFSSSKGFKYYQMRE